MNGKLVKNKKMRKLWEGFENFYSRMKDDRGNKMLMKMKDWKKGEDFEEMMKYRLREMMRVLNLEEYNNRNGSMNIESRINECFVRKDIGNKM
jgi:hypothetical protein